MPATPPPTGRCARCHQTRPLFTFTYMSPGWDEMVPVDVCARCHSASAVESGNGRLEEAVFTLGLNAGFAL